MSAVNDHNLVRRCIDGDRMAFEGIVDRYHKAIFNAALRIVSNTDDAADVTQTVFAKAFEKLHTFKYDHKLFSWLYRIAVNEALNSIQRVDRFVELKDDEILAEQEAATDSLYDENEMSKTIEDALGRLTVDSRVVIVLYHFQQLSYAEISYVLDVPEKTVKSRLFEARNQLRKILEQKRYSPYA
jgi:RNA polymerase sigma-70 factor (ECF subfamily)